ncbi:MAG: modification methyltransferase, partial [Anaerolineales bacterium]|nr:modification methyltransferase [Anaerolineales bacterium]
GILKRIVQASSLHGETVLDFFAGSGTTGEAAHQLGRKFILIDNNPEAAEVMKKRLGHLPDVEFVKWSKAGAR